MNPGGLARRVAIDLAGLLVLVALFAVVAVRYTDLGRPGPVAHRFAAVSAEADADALARLQAAGNAAATAPPLLLSYHDIRPDAPRGDRYTVSPEQLAGHLALLRAAGYESITTDQLVAWLDGTGTLPPKPVMITFDDGTSGVWRYADATLEAYGFRGVAFIITGRIGTHRPYYMTWEEIDRLRQSGRWDIESHTKAGHDRIPIDAEGDRQPFLINRRWLDGEQRLETTDELAARVTADLRGSVSDLADQGLARPRLFAFPFSAETNPTNDPAAPARTAEIVSQLFSASTTNVMPDRLVTDRDRQRRTLPRLEVFHATTAADLATRIVGAGPLPPGPADPATDPSAWTDSAGEPLAGAATEDVDQRSELADEFAFDPPSGSITLRPPSGDYLVAYHAPGRSTDWRDYRVAADLAGLGAGDAGATGSLFALLGSDAQVQVAVSATYARVSVGRDDHGSRAVVAESRLPSTPQHHVAIEVAAGHLLVSIDGRRLADTALPPSGTATGGIAVAGSDGPVTFSGMSLERL